MITEENFLDIADLLPEPMFLIGRQGRIMAANSAALDVLGYKSDDPGELNLYELVCDPKRKIAEYLRACFRSAELILGAVDLRSSTGQVISVRVEGCLAQLNVNGQPSLIMIRCVDKRKSSARFLSLNQKLDEVASERILLRQSNTDMEELQRLALVDSLTSLPNRRSLDKNLNHEWKRAARDGKPLSCLLIDIDYFKLFNDAYGHLAGDACLKEVSRAVQVASQRPADLTSRYGGEEFAVLLPLTQREGAVIVAERIRKEIERLGILHSDSKISDVVTASIGVATVVPSMEGSALELLSKADKALYHAKSSGRNCVHVFGRAYIRDKDPNDIPASNHQAQ